MTTMLRFDQQVHANTSLRRVHAPKVLTTYYSISRTQRTNIFATRTTNSITGRLQCPFGGNERRVFPCKGKNQKSKSPCKSAGMAARPSAIATTDSTTIIFLLFLQRTPPPSYDSIPARAPPAMSLEALQSAV